MRGAVPAAGARARGRPTLQAACSCRPSARSQSIRSISAASRNSSSCATSSRPRDSSWSPASVGPRQSGSASWKQLGGALELTLGDELARARATRTSHAARIEPLRLDVQPVAAGCGRDRIAPARERLAQLRQVDVDRLARGRRRRLPPQVVDQALARDELVRVQEQDSRGRVAPSASRARPVPVLDHLERPEDPKLHGAVLPLREPDWKEPIGPHRPNPVLSRLLPSRPST